MPEKILRHFCDRLLANLKIDYGPHLLRSGHFERYGHVAPTNARVAGVPIPLPIRERDEGRASG